ncbi:hypothetical protein OG613_36500 [Streptomyces sp. NBC_00015]|uniref:hypothetical protein n=1 Tax=unclassified Streptomyces TaxID=2593676 RepID=UPI002252F2A2|nr:hypothetical protein [Streptomyces sp. NBC_00103]MCX5372156.1 hypothetical protein [Streptomyces sp. NBC_00103]
MSETTTTTTTARRRRFTAVPIVVAILATALTACGDATDQADTVVPVEPSLSSPATTGAPAPSGSTSASASPSTKASAGSRSPSASTSGKGTTGRSGGSGASGSGGTGGGSGGRPGSGGSGGSGGGGGSGTGSGSGSGGRATSGAGAPAVPELPTAARLSSALLTTGQLPAGYVRTDLRNDPPTRSNRPGCVTTLNALESYRSTRPGAVEARATFAQSQSGPFLQEVVRALPGSGARQDLQQAAAVLSGCGEFAIGWSDGMTGTERVVAHGSAGIGDASWHATVTATSETFTVQETLVLVVVGKTLVVLSEAGSPTAPARSRTLSLARTAASRLP